jgi:phenylacetate-CoA ligase
MNTFKPEIEFASIERIKAFQNEALQKMLQYINLNSPYYKSRFKALNIDISKIKTVDDLSALPVTTKDDLAAYNEDFLCVPKEDIIDYITTSGTIGDPVTLMMTDQDLERLAYNEAISFAVADGSKSDVYQLMTTIDKRFMAGMAYFLGVRKLGAGIIRVGSGIPEMQWDSIARMKPNAIIAVPSFLLKLIEYAEGNGIDYRNSSIKKAICIGEPLRNTDFTLNTLGTKIKEKWDIELYSTYASTEMATAFTECHAGRGGHHHPELIIIELLDENNKPVSDGMPGEVTITTLGVEGMPLLRYKTGDVCHVHRESCTCGRNTLRLGPVIGRKNQMIKYKGTTIFPSSIYEVLNAQTELESYMVVVSTNDIGTDDILIKLATKGNTAHDFEKKLKDHFRASLRVAPAIEILSADELRKIQFPESLRKPITFLDRRI